MHYYNTIEVITVGLFLFLSFLYPRVTLYKIPLLSANSIRKYLSPFLKTKFFK